MEKIRLGRTELMVSRSGFGAIPIQRLDFDGAKAMLRHAYENGINFYDTARGYTDSEEKIGYALGDVRKEIVIATKTHAKTAAALEKDLETSLRNLKTDYIDIYQFHNPDFMPGEDSEIYQAAKAAQRAGKIRFISITFHKLALAIEAVKSGLYDTMQFPLSCISADEDVALAKLCAEHDIGVIAMKAMAGGLITDARPTFAFLRGLGNVVPIWGVQHMWELEQFLELEKNPPTLDDELLGIIEKDKKELAGNFCRGCGYCVPTCPASIKINTAARMSLLLRRTSINSLVSEEARKDMQKIEDCIDCGICITHCPYGLDTPALLKREYAFYKEYIANNAK